MHPDVDLHRRFQIRNFQKNRAAVVERQRGPDFEPIVAERVGIVHAKFRRAVAIGVFVVPLLRKIVSWIGGFVRIQFFGEIQPDTV